MDGFSPARTQWDEDGHLRSEQYGDIYGSRQGALAQARHVFLGGNRLAERFAALPEGGLFVVGETGFGTGLTFLAALQLFEKVAPANARLHFVSVEKHPLAADEAAKSWPAEILSPQAQALAAQWPAPLPGTHRLLFDLGQGRGAHLTLLYGDVAQALVQADAGRGVEAWFFDGFSPQKNPAMWSQVVFAQAARLSAPGATLATWSVSSTVRENLAAAGFAFEKQPGFGNKQEMLGGRLPSATQGASSQAKGQSALVVGAGIGGCAIAHALAVRGVRVTLVDGKGVGQHSSGNAQGLVQPMFAGASSPEGNLTRAAFWFAARFLRQVAPDLWHPTGSLWWREPKKIDLFARRVGKINWPESLLRLVSKEEASAIAGMELPSSAIYCPVSGWVEPARLCARLAGHPNITFEQRQVAQVRGDEADWVVIANGECAPALVATLGEKTEMPPIELIPVRGQCMGLPQVAASQNLRTVLHFGNYITPAMNGRHTVGATHQTGDLDLALRDEDDAALLAEVAAAIPALAGAWRDLPHTSRCGVRCQVADHMPLIGFVPGFPQVALMAALGPRGISTALLGAELLAAKMFGEPLPVPADWAKAMAPGRLPATSFPPDA